MFLEQTIRSKDKKGKWKNEKKYFMKIITKTELG